MPRLSVVKPLAPPSGSTPSRHVTSLIAVFSLAFAVFVIAPVALGEEIPFFPLLQVSEVVDLFTPVVLFPLYWLLYRYARQGPVSTREGLGLLVGAGFWGVGHGVHLSANSIGQIVRRAETGRLLALTHLYDEVIGHYFWHTGVVVLSALIVWRAVRDAPPPRMADAARERESAREHEREMPSASHRPGAGRTTLLALWLPAAAYGTTFFLMVVEGGTAPLGIPAAIGLLAFSLAPAKTRAAVRSHPVAAFFCAAHAIALVLFAGWAGYWRGLPQFSAIGIID